LNEPLVKLVERGLLEVARDATGQPIYRNGQPAYKLSAQAAKLDNQALRDLIERSPATPPHATTEELVLWVEGRMQEDHQAQCGHPPIKAALERYDSGEGNLITVAEVISDMGLEPTPELVLGAEEAMVNWFEHEFKDVDPIDDGGLSCYYTYNGNYYYREEIFRKKIEEIVRVVQHAKDS
jgi:hypothetical protein